MDVNLVSAFPVTQSNLQINFFVWGLSRIAETENFDETCANTKKKKTFSVDDKLLGDDGENLRA